MDNHDKNQAFPSSYRILHDQLEKVKVDNASLFSEDVIKAKELYNSVKELKDIIEACNAPNHYNTFTRV